MIQSTATLRHKTDGVQLWLLSALAIVFWLTALQPGGSLALFAESNTAQSITLKGHTFRIGPTDFASLHGLLVIVLLPRVGTPLRVGYAATARAIPLR